MNVHSSIIARLRTQQKISCLTQGYTSSPGKDCIQWLVNVEFTHLTSLPQLRPFCRAITTSGSVENLLWLHPSATSPNFTQFCFSHPSQVCLLRAPHKKNPTYQSQSLIAYFLGNLNRDAVKLSVPLERRREGWHLGQKWEKVNRLNPSIGDIIFFFWHV